jgi:hypothetical protein
LRAIDGQADGIRQAECYFGDGLCCEIELNEASGIRTNAVEKSLAALFQQRELLRAAARSCDLLYCSIRGQMNDYARRLRDKGITAGPIDFDIVG